MKKLLQKIYSYKNLVVTDADTGNQELAQYQMIFGLVFKVKYIKMEAKPSEQKYQKEVLKIIENAIKNSHPILE